MRTLAAAYVSNWVLWISVMLYEGFESVLASSTLDFMGVFLLLFVEDKRTALLSGKEAWCCSGVPAAGPAHWPVVSRDKIRWLWPSSVITSRKKVSTEPIHRCHYVTSAMWTHPLMLFAERWGFMGTGGAGFPKSLIDLFHIRPALHYHLGWDNPCCCLCSLYYSSALHWLYWHFGPIYNPCTSLHSKEFQNDPWQKHWIK